MSTKEQVESVLNTIPDPEITEFMEHVQERASKKPLTSDAKMDEAIQDLFILDDYQLEGPVAEVLKEEIGRALNDYMEGSLFTIEVPTFEDQFHREFWRYRREERGTNGFKQVYRSEDGEHIALLPSRGETLRDRAERVVTWLHNAETIAAEGLSMPTDFNLTVAERNGVTYPALLGEYNTQMTLGAEMEEDDRENIWPELAEAGYTVARLVTEGMVASSKINDYYGPGTEFNQAYDFTEDKVVVPELGEIHEPNFQRDIVDCDSREEFLTRHGIDERVDRYLQAFGLEESYTPRE